MAATPDTAAKMDVDKPAKQEGSHSRNYDLPWVRALSAALHRPCGPAAHSTISCCTAAGNATVMPLEGLVAASGDTASKSITIMRCVYEPSAATATVAPK
jgi:hypothetical protein